MKQQRGMIEAPHVSKMVNDRFELPNPIVLILDTAGDIEQINNSGCKLLGYHRNALIGQNWLSYCLPEPWRTRIRLVFDKLISGATEELAYYVAAVQTQSGRQYTLSWHSEPRFNREGVITGTLNTGMHIADSVLAQQDALLQSAARNQAVLDNAIEAIISIDDHGVITHVNKTTGKIFGYRENELVGKNIRCLMPAPHAAKHDSYIDRYLKTGEKKIIGIGREVVALRKDGSEVPVDLTVTETTVNGKRCFTGIMRDISERKIAEQRLKKSEEETRQACDRLAHMDRLHIATEMSTGIAHELNQPLAAISLYAQACQSLLRNGALDADKLLHTLSRIDSQAQRAGNVIRGLRALVSKQKPHHEVMDINRLIQATVEMAHVGIDSQGMVIECHLAPALPRVDIVPEQIQQVLLNLIRNACDAMATNQPTDKLVTITTRRNTDKDFVTVAVRDQGSGIHKLHTDRILQPFFSTKKTGMGMGLAISLSIVNNHGGDLTLNRHYQRGAEFSFTLPTMSALET